MRAVLRNRSYRALLAGQTLSMFGSSALIIAFAIWVKDLTGSNSAAGLVFMVLALPALATPLFGAVIDRYPRRQVMIATDLVLAAGVSCLFLVRDEGDVWIVYAVAALYAIGQPVFGAAKSGLLTGMLPEEQLADANGLLDSMRQALRLVAPLAGAGLYAAAGGAAVAALDVATFVVSAVILLRLRAPDIERRREPLRIFAGFGEGLAHLRRTPDLRLLVACIVLTVATVGLLEGAALLALMDLIGKPPEFLGPLLTIQGIGAIAGGVLSGWSIRRLGELRVSGIALALIGLGFALCTPAELGFVLASAVVLGLGITPINVAFATLAQRRTPLELQGRLFTAVEPLISIPYALAIGLGAVLVAFVDVRWLYGLNGVWILAVAAYLLTRPSEAPLPRAAPDLVA